MPIVSLASCIVRPWRNSPLSRKLTISTMTRVEHYEGVRGVQHEMFGGTLQSRRCDRHLPVVRPLYDGTENWIDTYVAGDDSNRIVRGWQKLRYCGCAGSKLAPGRAIDPVKWQHLSEDIDTVVDQLAFTNPSVVPSERISNPEWRPQMSRYLYAHC